MIRRLTGIGLIILFWATAPVFSAPMSSVSEYHLNNGLTVLIKQDHRAPVVFSSVWYKVGGSYEHNGITGISHMLEHMMFRGTKRYGPGQFKLIMGRIGAVQNAFTSRDCTVYYQEFSKEHLPLVLGLEADRMHNLQLLKNTQSRRKE